MLILLATPLTLTLLVTGCNATQPHYPGYIINFNNPCKSTYHYQVIFNEEKQYKYTVSPDEKGELLDLFMKQALLDELDKSFTVEISSSEDSIVYTPNQVNKNFYITKLNDVDIWVVDAGELCGKDLLKLKQKQKHTQIIVN